MPHMRAAIFGLGCSEKDLKPFREIAPADWMIGMPATPADANAILMFGGDGTVHRHLAQLVKLQLPLLVIPAGSGNDFARALHLRRVRDSLTAWENFSSGRNNIRAIDLGVISWLGEGAKRNQQYFCSVGGVGLDAETARRANQLPRWLRGHGGYALSLPGALLGFEAQKMRISQPSADRPAELEVRSDEPTFLAAFANTSIYGGGMKIAPRAAMDDGKLDVCLIREINKLKLFCLFPSVYFGRHLSVPQVDYFQTERVRIETESPMDVYADGEYVCRTPIEVGVHRAALRVIVPPQC
jgi:diacylglycerol kinase (ATP)